MTKKFGELLTDGIYLIRVREHKDLTTIMDELGYAVGRTGGSAITHWRRGNIPSDYNELEILLKEVVKRGKCDKKWLKEILFQTDYSSDALCHELFPEETMNNELNRFLFPYKNHWNLIGREKIVNDILVALQKSEHQIITIDGLGGIGKTAIALEVAEKCKEAQFFDAIVMMISSRLLAIDSLGQGQVMTFESILDLIGTQLGSEDFVSENIELKFQAVKSILSKKKVLLILDNMETASEPQESIVQRLSPLLGNSKAILTSRHRFKDKFWGFHLKGLKRLEARKFIEQDAIAKNIKTLARIKSKERDAIIKATGGSPLALELVISQLGHMEVHPILEYLVKAASFNEKGRFNEYEHLYKFIFYHSWQFLTETDKKLLLSIALFDTSDGCSFDALANVSGFEMFSLATSIEALWDSSLVEVKPHEQSLVRYFLHPLTHNFVLANASTN